MKSGPKVLPNIKAWLTDQGPVWFSDSQSVAPILGKVWNHIFCDRLHNQSWKYTLGVFDTFDLIDEEFKDFDLEVGVILEGRSGVSLSEASWIGRIQLFG